MDPKAASSIWDAKQAEASQAAQDAELEALLGRLASSMLLASVVLMLVKAAHDFSRPFLAELRYKYGLFCVQLPRITSDHHHAMMLAHMSCSSHGC